MPRSRACLPACLSLSLSGLTSPVLASLPPQPSALGLPTRSPSRHARHHLLKTKPTRSPAPWKNQPSPPPPSSISKAAARYSHFRSSVVSFSLIAANRYRVETSNLFKNSTIFSTLSCTICVNSRFSQSRWTARACSRPDMVRRILEYVVGKARLVGAGCRCRSRLNSLASTFLESQPAHPTQAPGKRQERRERERRERKREREAAAARAPQSPQTI